MSRELDKCLLDLFALRHYSFAARHRLGHILTCMLLDAAKDVRSGVKDKARARDTEDGEMEEEEEEEKKAENVHAKAHERW